MRSRSTREAAALRLSVEEQTLRADRKSAELEQATALVAKKNAELEKREGELAAMRDEKTKAAVKW